MSAYLTKQLKFLREHLVLLVLICIATFLRTFQLDHYAILFPDAGHDLLVAHQFVSTHSFPIHGIASSHPWLYQGPLALWWEMLIMVVAGTSTYAQSLAFSVVGIAAVIALYELLAIYATKTMAYFAVAFLAVFPLAVAHSRVPYHTTFIPLATVLYLFGLMNIWKKFSFKTLIIALLTWLLLVQFELSNAFLILLIPYIIWRRKYKIEKKYFGVGIGLIIVGLLPQLWALFRDHQYSFSETISWLISKVITAVSSHSQLSLQKISLLIQSSLLYSNRIFSLDQWPLAVLGGILLVISISFAITKWRRKKLLPVIELALVMGGILLLSYFLVGTFSEAYTPPFFILIAILCSFVCSSWYLKYKWALIASVSVYLFWNTITIYRNHFFVATDDAFSYESVAEHRAIAYYLAVASQGKIYQLNTASDAKAEIPALFDHISWLALEAGLPQPSDEGQLFLVESNQTPPPDQIILLKKFQHKSIYKVLNF